MRNIRMSTYCPRDAHRVVSCRRRRPSPYHNFVAAAYWRAAALQAGYREAMGGVWECGLGTSTLPEGGKWNVRWRLRQILFSFSLSLSPTHLSASYTRPLYVGDTDKGGRTGRTAVFITRCEFRRVKLFWSTLFASPGKTAPDKTDVYLAGCASIVFVCRLVGWLRTDVEQTKWGKNAVNSVQDTAARYGNEKS